MKSVYFFFTTFSCFVNPILSQNILHVGPGRTYANPVQAAAQAKPGDTILLHPATYTGPFFIDNLAGNSRAWITIKGTNRDQVIFQGGSESLHFTDPKFVIISDMTITGQTGNGMNIDDGGTYDTPAKHVLIQRLTFRNMAASGNNDMLKLSGLDSFTVSHCHFENGAAGGSGIDMVGCHYGNFNTNRFINQGSNSIQAKGASSHIHIERNYFTNGGQRTLNLGGSTGAAFFRPFGANYEARDLLVTANIIEGSDAPIAFVGCRNVQVINNTIIHPVNWIMRILQESSDTSFYQSCANNVFANNIVVVNNTLRTDVNIGPNTVPASFKFSNNLWYHSQNTSWNGPQLPAAESARLVQNPMFVDLLNKNYALANGSAAIGSGRYYTGYNFDFANKSFANPPSRGAIEKNMVIQNEEYTWTDIQLYPNPCRDILYLNNVKKQDRVSLISPTGKVLYSIIATEKNISIPVRALKEGIYFIQINQNHNSITKIFIKLNS
jgi:hypothetical protein